MSTAHYQNHWTKSESCCRHGDIDSNNAPAYFWYCQLVNPRFTYNKDHINRDTENEP